MRREIATFETEQLKTEINLLKEQLARLESRLSISQPEPPALPASRRKALKRLGGLLLGGVATGAALANPPSASAKVSADPTGTVFNNRVGAFIAPPGAAAPTGTTPSYYYGLVATGDTTVMNVSSLPSVNIGVYGGSSSGYGVYGSSSSSHGVYGYSNSATSYGVFGYNYSGAGVYGTSYSDNGVYGNSSGGGTGVYGNSSGGTGVYGNSSGGGTGVYGYSNSGGTGVYGWSNSGDGVYGYSGGAGTGVYGANSSTGYAGYFVGNVRVIGSVTKASGSFKIDHPLDPANKYLYHSFVESPDMLNIYNGNVTLDEQGEAEVSFPAWFEVLNRDFRYQLTAIGQASSVYISKEISNGSFGIAGGLPGQRISWMVTGIRQDAFANAHRIPVEEDKPDEEKGKYLHPTAWGQSEEMGVDYAKGRAPTVENESIAERSRTALVRQLI
jgi:hypothetical protein